MITVTPSGSTAITFSAPQVIDVEVSAAVIVRDSGGISIAPIQVQSVGQTIFPLTINPPNPSNTYVTVNGIVYDFGYSYSLSNYLLTWSNDPFPLNPSDRFTLYY